MSSHSALDSSSFNEFNASLQAAAVKATQHAVRIPTSDIQFHRSMDPELAEQLDSLSNRMLSITNRLLALTAHEGSRGRKIDGHDAVIDDFQRSVVDQMDYLLERTDVSLDAYLGRSKAPAITINPKPATTTKNQLPSTRLDPKLLHASQITKPQTKFKTRVNNHDASPWLPILKHKHNAQVPLGYNYRLEGESVDNDQPESNHPYRFEISHISYPKHMFTAPSSSDPPQSFDKTPFTYVDTPSKLATMIDTLRDACEIAVDLEHHSYRSFAGFVCLMQVSTREADWVIDCLALREEMHTLNEVFSDPAIVKVFHGADSDIVWLQQDFGIYVVNLFDTYHASKVLSFPSHGLAHLLQMFCDFTPDKRYQLADWRIRPLPQEMLHYARSDTHYLLYIYDRLRDALLSNPTATATADSAAPAADSSIREVLRRSEITALRTYEREIYDAETGFGPNGWATLAKKWNGFGFSKQGDGPVTPKMAVFRAIHKWRDETARTEDESTRYVLPNQHVMQIADRMPTDMNALLAMFPGQNIPPVLRRRAAQLLEIIKVAARRAETIAPQASSAEVPNEDDQEPTPTEVEIPAQAPKSSTPNLWDLGEKSNLARASSSLLGTQSSTKPSPGFAINLYHTARSSLLNNAPQVLSQDMSNNEVFEQLKRRIHSTLVIAPTVPKITSLIPPVQRTEAEEMAVNPEEVIANDIVAVEHAYVPSSQRQTLATQVVEDDSIVVVGRRQKKRKRVQATHATGPKTSAESISASAEQTPEAEEEFDYSSVPNILDDVAPPVDAPKKKKQKQKGPGTFEYGNFPAPPKAQREVKSGNQSRTFKK